MKFPPPPVKPKLTASELDADVKSLVRIAIDDGHGAANAAFQKIVQQKDLRTWEASVVAARFQQELKEAMKKEPRL